MGLGRIELAGSREEMVESEAVRKPICRTQRLQSKLAKDEFEIGHRVWLEESNR